MSSLGSAISRVRDLLQSIDDPRADPVTMRRIGHAVDMLDLLGYSLSTLDTVFFGLQEFRQKMEWIESRQRSKSDE